MNIGMICYASIGGSGVVATELAKCLASRGHQIHLISAETPFRLGSFQSGLSFHRVQRPSYPLFRESQYLLPLANRIVQLSREFSLDVVHAHYAIPHATAAYLAREIAATTDGVRVPKIITTLHGTDITLLGSDPSYKEAVAFSIDRSDGVTAVSASLKAETYRALSVRSDIQVIHNFVSCAGGPAPQDSELRARLMEGGFEKLVIHVSNFRPVKRVDAVIEIFRRIRSRVRAKLLLVGEGPELDRACGLVRDLHLSQEVEALGEQERVLPILSTSDLFLLPSADESFGMAALEAMSCGVPVVGSRVGGVPEVVEHGVTGLLHPPSDVEAMAESAVTLLTDADVHDRMSVAARRRVEQHFCAERIVPQYESFYEAVCGRATPSGR